VLLAPIGAVALVLALVKPSPLTRLAYDRALGNADVPGIDVPMYWSLRVHDRDGWRRLQLEGGTRSVTPSRIRVVTRGGGVVAEGATLPLVQGRTLGVCGTHDLLGSLWWARDLDPPVLASLFSGDGEYRVEAEMADGWRRVRLFDTGCRILDRGRA
jgi:hypothetical protein